MDVTDAKVVNVVGTGVVSGAAVVVVIKDEVVVVVKDEVVVGIKDEVVGIATQSVTFVEADDEFVPMGQSLQLDAWVSSWYCPGKQTEQDVASCRLRARRTFKLFIILTR